MAKKVAAHKGPHKYLRVKLKKSTVYRCILPGCPHYLIDRNLLINRMGRCFYCDSEFLITQKLAPANRKRIYCENCTERKEKIKVKDTVEFLDELKKEI
jgi:hypothetical protein